MLAFLRCFLLASAPALFILWFYYRRDRWDPEPKRLVLKLFCVGAVAAVPAYFVQGWLPGPQGGAYDFFVRVALVEELFKFAPLLWFALRRKEFDEPMDGIVYAVAAALGFASAENALYATVFGDQVIVQRAFTATLAHVGFSGLIGYQFGKAWFRHAGWLQFPVAFAAAVGLHGAYDMLLDHASRPGAPAALTQGTIVVIIPLMLIMLSWAANKADRVSPFRKQPDQDRAG